MLCCYLTIKLKQSGDKMNKIISILVVALTVSMALGQNVSQAIRELQSAKADINSVKNYVTNYEVVRKLNDALSKIDNSIYQLNSGYNGGGNNGGGNNGGIIATDQQIINGAKNNRIVNCSVYYDNSSGYNQLYVRSVFKGNFQVGYEDNRLANSIRKNIDNGTCWFR